MAQWRHVDVTSKKQHNPSLRNLQSVQFALELVHSGPRLKGDSMLVLKTGQGVLNLFASAYPGYQIIRRNIAAISFSPNRIAAALMQAYLGGRRTHQPNLTSIDAGSNDSIELSFAEWRRAMTTLGQSTARVWVMPMPSRMTSLGLSTGRSAKAFFRSQKVDGRNAP
jgi:hypothetical protein